MIKSYPKVNINLYVYEKNEEFGLHPIESIVTIVNDFYDEIEIEEIKEGVEMECNIASLNNQENFVAIAANYLIHKHNLNIGFKINIKKNVPIGSGMGGGNSNAMAVAKWIVGQYDLQDDLMDVCKLTGTDSYFFLYGFTSARVTGFGDIVKQIDDIPMSKDDLIINTNINCDTTKVYSEFDRAKGWKENQENMLLTACLKLYPQLCEFEEHRLSGSGSTFIKKEKIESLKEANFNV